METTTTTQALRDACLYDSDTVGSHTIELWMDSASHNDEAWRWHWLIVDGARPTRYKNRDAAMVAWRAQVELWADEAPVASSDWVEMPRDFDNLETWQ